MKTTLDSLGIRPRPDFGQLRDALLRQGKPAYVPFYELFVDPPIMEQLLGGFDVDRLCRSSEAEIRAHVDLLIDQVGPDGGYALGSGNSIARYVPPDHYLTMLDQGWKRR